MHGNKIKNIYNALSCRKNSSDVTKKYDLPPKVRHDDLLTGVRIVL